MITIEEVKPLCYQVSIKMEDEYYILEDDDYEETIKEYVDYVWD